MLAATAAAATLTGSLFRYKHPSWPAPLQAFESPAVHEHRNFCVYVGGLTDGLLACGYVEALGAELDRRGWALVQPVLTSSYAGYGCSSLAKDAAEISELLAHLVQSREGVNAFAIVGHSTGCQDAVTLLGSAPPGVRQLIRAAILQAPVSDREAASLEGDEAERSKLLLKAESLIAQGQGDALLLKHYGFVPMSAERYVSLVGRGTPDDMFSSDFSDEQLGVILSPMGTGGQRDGRRATLGYAAIEPVAAHPGLKTLFVHSAKDEYVPPTVDAVQLSQRFVRAAGGAESGAAACIIPEANHNLASPPGAASAFVTAVGEWLELAVSNKS